MPESQMETSSSVDPKPKKSLFDEDVGNDFLSSWKSISASEGDTMDFNFDTVSTDKKRAFNFDKLDMDFNLEGDFDKLSSFKLDMADLDFSSPSNKTAKLKERAGGESSSKKKQGKQDSFTFSFDFNDLDSFDLDSSLSKEAKIQTKNLERKELSSDDDSQGSKTNVIDGVLQLENCKTEKLPASENGVTLMVESAVGGTETDKSLNENFPSRSEIFDNQIVSESNSPVEVEKRNQQSFSLGKNIQTESSSKQITECVPAQYLGGDHLTKDTVLETEKEDDFPARKVNVELLAELNDIDKIITIVGSDHEKTELIYPSPECGIGSESNKTESEKVCNKIPKEITLETAPTVDGEATSVASVSKIMSHESETDKDILNSSAGISVPLSSGPVMHAVALGKAGDFNVNACQRSKESEHQLYQPPANGVEISSSGFKGTSNVHLSHPEAGLRETGSDKLASIKENDPAVACSNIYGISEKKTEPQLCQLSASVKASSSGRKIVSDIHLTHTETGKSVHVVDKVALIEEKENRVIVSKFFRRSEECKPQLCQPSSEVEFSSSKCREIDSAGLSLPVNRKQEGTDVVDANIERKLLVSGSQPLPNESIRGPSTQLGPYKNVKTLYSIRDSFEGEGLQNGGKLGVNPIADNEASEENPIALRSRTYLPKSGCVVNRNNLTDKPIKLNSLACLKHGKKAITQKEMTFIEGIEDEKWASDCSSLRISRNMEASKDQPRSSCLVEINLSRNLAKSQENQAKSEKHLRAVGSSERKLAVKTQEHEAKSKKHVHPVASSERQTPVITCLKRKLFEVTSTDVMHFNPQKRLSVSPSESRVVREPRKNIKQVSYHDDQSESESMDVLYDRPLHGPEIPQASMKALEIPLAIEYDGNVEKAEVYAKELENICNMLKKKHEEAKELLVQAVVNNNSLLMLNHPIFDEKISFYL